VDGHWSLPSDTGIITQMGHALMPMSMLPAGDDGLGGG